MRLTELEPGPRWRVLCADDALAFLSQQPNERQAHAKGLRALLRRYAQGGRQALTAELFHEADHHESIWEFRKGALRLYCFIDKGDTLTVLTHGAVKKTAKTAKGDLVVACAARDRYLEAKANHTLTIKDHG